MPLTTCPSCEIAMEVQHYEDVLIDICPSCRGVWMDRGEMQKIIAHVRRQEAEVSSGEFRHTPRADREPESRREPRHEEPYRKRRKRSIWDLLEEIID